MPGTRSSRARAAPRLHPHRLLHPRGDPNGTQDRRRPLVVDPGPMPLPRRDQRPRPRRRHHLHPAPARAPAPAPRTCRTSRRHARYASSVVTSLQHRRDQRLQHARPLRVSREPRPPMPGRRHAAGAAARTPPVVRAPEQLRQRLQQPLRPWPPGLPAHHPRADAPRPGASPGRRESGWSATRTRPASPGTSGRRARAAAARAPARDPAARSGTHARTRPAPPPAGGTPARRADMPTAHGRTRGPRSEPSCHE